MVARRILTVALAAAALSACTVGSSKAPDLVGPSSLGLALDIKASPDVLFRDGVAQSVIQVTATNGDGANVAGLGLQVVASPNLGTIQTGFVTTDASGKASTVYTAPGFGSTTTATITVTPTGSNFQQTVPRTITIRLFQPPLQ